ncbi:organic hydroperoxide resistance protein [Mesoterricola silvestris]|uniref:Organic hydroperoxide resistance protein n=1 Tax=Mesoterricola silvestris TaxID=2927979 RepID=A0AA48GLJ7_9BACT|nr:organic hydroperoxide resistance protein [Mesoterricola silvestris]BDU71695.1 organic hydroperoxide resistance protein [Mesoterricola silvestris]
MNPLYEIKASANGGRAGRVTSEDGVLDFQLALPKGLGGPGGAQPNPEMLFAAGYAACFQSALGFVAGGAKVRLGTQRVDATVGIGPKDGGGFQLAVKLEVYLPDLPRDQAQAFMEQAHQVCPYSNAVRGNVPVELVLL